MDNKLVIPCLFIVAGLTGAVLIGMSIYSSPSAILESLRSPEVLFSLILSLYTTCIGITIGCIVGIPTGYFLARNDFPGKIWLDSFLNTPIVLPGIVGGIGLLILFGPLLGDTLKEFGIKFVFTRSGIVLANFFVGTPYIIRTAKTTFEGIDPRYEFIAMTMGCSQWRAFTETTLKLAKHGLLAGAILGWSRAFAEFGVAYMLVGYVLYKTSILPITIFSKAVTGNLDLALAGSLIMVLISMMALIVSQKLAGQSALH
jgi:molybdate transport system permease protein